MKKVFNLAVIFAALLLGTTFTSCSEDEPAVVDIQIVATPTSAGITLAGTISSDNKLDDIVILNSAGNSTVITLDPEKVKEDGAKYFVYTINETLPFDAYTIKATDDNANESTKAFGEKLNLNMGDATSQAYGSFLSIKDGAVYTVSQVNAGKAANVEIIYNGALLSAAEATNAKVLEAGNSASLTAIAGGYYYSTSTGFSGAIMTTVGSAEISLIVYKFEDIVE